MCLWSNEDNVAQWLKSYGSTEILWIGSIIYIYIYVYIHIL